MHFSCTVTNMVCKVWVSCEAQGIHKREGADMCVRCVQHADGHVVYEFEPACHLGAKLAGVHWWFKSRVHAAELTAGYYNTRERDGYADLMVVLKKHSARLSFTCVEMRDCEHPPEGRCSPEGRALGLRGWP